MKKLMVLGAGIYQVPLIRQAKEMGIYTIVVSIQGKYPGFEYADQIYYADTKDSDAVLRIAEKEQIDGIVTSGTDVAVAAIGKVCDKLGLPGLSFHAAEIATDKMLMKEKYESFGVRTARYRKIYFENMDLGRDVKELHLPLVFKAVDTSGSRGIVKVGKEGDFEDAVRVVRENTKKDYFIAEEFLEGEEFGAQAFIYHGRIQFILPHGDYVFQGNTGVPVGHWVPYGLDEDILADMEGQLEKAAAAMGLDNCAMNVDFIMVDRKVYVLEIGGRAGATCLPEMVSLYYGYNYYEKIILAALGDEPDFYSMEKRPNAGMLLRADQGGKIKGVNNKNKKEDPDIVDIQFDYGIGDTVRAFRIGPDRIGHAIVKGSGEADVKKKIEDVVGKIEVTVG